MRRSYLNLYEFLTLRVIFLDFGGNQPPYSRARLQAASTRRGLSNGATLVKIRPQGESQSPSVVSDYPGVESEFLKEPSQLGRPHPGRCLLAHQAS